MTQPRSINKFNLTVHLCRPSIKTMTEKNIIPADSAISKLENRLNDLLGACDTLKKENSHLRDENSVLISERGQLLSNRDKVRGQVEAMINRLKAMETS